MSMLLHLSLRPNQLDMIPVLHTTTTITMAIIAPNETQAILLHVHMQSLSHLNSSTHIHTPALFCLHCQQFHIFSPSFVSLFPTFVKIFANVLEQKNREKNETFSTCLMESAESLLLDCYCDCFERILVGCVGWVWSTNKNSSF